VPTIWFTFALEIDCATAARGFSGGIFLIGLRIPVASGQ
jgi:hypothetical protein